jgi:hypothetical protein
MIEKHFSSLAKARKWLSRDAQKQKADPGSIIELEARTGPAAFELSSVQLNEAIAAFKRLEETNLGLTEAVDYAIKHSRLKGGRGGLYRWSQAKAAAKLGFPGSGWHRTHYLSLLNLLSSSVSQISKHLKNGAS